MSPERWQQIEKIFQDALDLAPSERKRLVAEKCGDDAELKAEVEKLLMQFEEASSFIETPALNDSQAGIFSALRDFDEDDPMLGAILGNYRIEREIGRGGMGAVYEAVRADGEFRRKAAIKIVKRGMDTDFILRRFRNERQILATLEHPFITRLIDGGTTADGRPYFVMDFIEGLPLYSYADKNRLTIKERLRLFTKVCQAVEYAHQNLVIHRDLKPSNILVMSEGSPRLLDFGIAKLLDPEMASDTLQPTATAMRMMTIDYASPEQIKGEEITFATDIYSLGVILFELLTGHRPYRFASRTPHEIARVICENAPTLPSDAVGRSENTLPIIDVDREALTIRHLAELRRETPAELADELKGNLDNITLKALSKLPDERYRSIEKFRADIEKHLVGKQLSTPFHFPRKTIETGKIISQNKIIAVLPLKLLNFAAAVENTDENYLSIGLADAIITRLTSLREYTVRPTSSISNYDKSDTDPLQAGRELGVDFVLDGRIKKFGNKLRVSLQMLDVGRSAILWAGQFDENFTDVLSLEDAISDQVVEALVSQVTGETNVKLGRRGTENAEAYEAYLKGRFHWNQFTTDSLPKAIEYFQKAVALDPNYALAYVGIADFYIWADIYGLIPGAVAVPKAEEAVKKALEIDEKIGEAYTTYGLLQTNKFDWQEGELLHRKAIELSPNYPNAHEWLSANLVGKGLFEEGIKEIEHAEALDPLSLRTKTLVAWTKYQAQDFDAALAKADEIINFDENFPQGHLQRGNVLIELGRGAEAVAEVEKVLKLMPASSLVKFNYCFALTAADRLEDARKIYAKMKEEAANAYVKTLFIAYAAVAVGEIDEAFYYFNKAVAERDSWLNWFGVDVKLEPLRGDQRYLELLKRTKSPLLRRYAKSENTQIEYPKNVTGEEKIVTAPVNLKSNFFRRHKFKFAFAASLLILILVGIQTGSLTFDLNDRKGDRMQNTSPKKSLLAVLPFKNETENAENDFLTDGLSENLISRLSGLSQIQVIPRSTSFKYKKQQIDAKQAASELNADAIVSGKLVKHDENVEIIVEIFDKNSDQSPRITYTGKDSELIELQNKIVSDVLKELGQNNPNENRQVVKNYTENTQAFEFYLKGEFERQKSTPDGIKQAIEFYQKALEIDANYALAYQGLALAYRAAPDYGTLLPTEAYPLTKESAMKALAIDPTLGTAHVTLASIKATFDWDFAGAERDYKQAIQFSPNNAEGHYSYGNFLVSQGRSDEGLTELRIAQQFDPLSSNAATNIGWALYIAGRFDEAEAQIKQVLARDPNFARAYLNLGEIYEEEGKFDQAIELIQKSQKLSNDNLSKMALGHTYAMAGRRVEAVKIAQELESKVLKKEVSPFLPAVVYAGLKENDKAFYWLERAFQERSNWLSLAKIGRRLKPLHSDPRFDDLLERIGFQK